ncbi:MAG TPA: hypothetical protein VJR90_09755 [Gammaproteobacteria bacterium]|nr:hypothetical protein [Gammaproteobacteria bacterium]
MNKQVTLFFATLVALLLVTPLASAHAAHTTVWSVDNQGITLDGGDAVIHGDDGTQARITPDGTLTIAGKTITVNAAQRQQLVQYVATVRDIEIKGAQLGAAAGSFAAGVAAEAITALFAGASEDDIDRKAQTRANEFKKKALPICRDAQTLKQLQDSLQASLPAFEPYAVIEAHDAGDCEHDINSDD